MGLKSTYDAKLKVLREEDEQFLAQYLHLCKAHKRFIAPAYPNEVGGVEIQRLHSRRKRANFQHQTVHLEEDCRDDD